MNDGARGTDGPCVGRPAGPHTIERFRGTARDGGPGGAVPVHDGAVDADRPDVVASAPRRDREPFGGPARDEGPGGAVPVQDGAAVADSPDVVGCRAPHAWQVGGERLAGGACRPAPRRRRADGRTRDREARIRAGGNTGASRARGVEANVVDPHVERLQGVHVELNAEEPGRIPGRGSRCRAAGGTQRAILRDCGVRHVVLRPFTGRRRDREPEVVVAVPARRAVHTRGSRADRGRLRDREPDDNRHVALHPEPDAAGRARVVRLPVAVQRKAHRRAPVRKAKAGHMGGVAAGVPSTGDQVLRELTARRDVRACAVVDHEPGTRPAARCADVAIVVLHVVDHLRVGAPAGRRRPATGGAQGRGQRDREEAPH